MRLSLPFNRRCRKGPCWQTRLGWAKPSKPVLSFRKMAERRRRILIITPSNLRKQWFQELAEKFFLPCRILEAKSYNAAMKQGQFRPFEAPEIVICSYQFAKSKAGEVQAIAWDLVVIDEAHRLRKRLQTVECQSPTRSRLHWPARTSYCSPPRPCRTPCWSCSDWSVLSMSTPSAT